MRIILSILLLSVCYGTAPANVCESAFRDIRVTGTFFDATGDGSQFQVTSNMDLVSIGQQTGLPMVWDINDPPTTEYPSTSDGCYQTRFDITYTDTSGEGVSGTTACCLSLIPIESSDVWFSEDFGTWSGEFPVAPPSQENGYPAPGIPLGSWVMYGTVFHGDTGFTHGKLFGMGCNYDNQHTDSNGDSDECFTVDIGGTVETVCNCENLCGFAKPVDDCGICEGNSLSCAGCMYESACNYDADATIDDGSCGFVADYEFYANEHWDFARWIHDFYKWYPAEPPNWFSGDASLWDSIREVFVDNVGDYEYIWENVHIVEFTWNGEIISSISDEFKDEIFEQLCGNSSLDSQCSNNIEEVENIISHNSVDVIKNSTFYENIGKYNDYFAGWDDNVDVEVDENGNAISPHNSHYRILEAYYKTGFEVCDCEGNVFDCANVCGGDSFLTEYSDGVDNDGDWIEYADIFGWWDDKNGDGNPLDHGEWGGVLLEAATWAGVSYNAGDIFFPHEVLAEQNGFPVWVEGIHNAWIAVGVDEIHSAVGIPINPQIDLNIEIGEFTDTGWEINLLWESPPYSPSGFYSEDGNYFFNISNLPSGDDFEELSYNIYFFVGNIAEYENTYIGGPIAEGINELTYTDHHLGENDSLCYTVMVHEIVNSNQGAGPSGVGCSSYDNQVCIITPESPLIIQERLLPSSFQLSHAYPNPFNPTTTISFSIPEFGLTTITAYDITGRQLETLTNEVLSVGSYSINWNAASYPSGVYLIRMESGEFTQTQKVVLVK